MMDGQMSLWDFIPMQTDLDRLTEEEMIHMLEMATGLSFTKKVYAYDFYEYEAKRSKVTFSAKFDNYIMEDNKRRFISAGYDIANHGGIGCPCDTVDEAISIMKKGLAIVAKHESKGGHA